MRVFKLQPPFSGGIREKGSVIRTEGKWEGKRVVLEENANSLELCLEGMKELTSMKAQLKLDSINS